MDAVDTIAATDAGKVSKVEAQYGPGGRDHCGVCRYFVVLNPQRVVGACLKVRGPIGRQDWCKLFERERTASETTASVPQGER